MAHFLRHYGSLIGMAAIVLFFWVMLPDTFLTARNWLNITQQLSMLMVVAAGMTIVFVNTRAQAELMFQELWKLNADTLPIAREGAEAI